MTAPHPTTRARRMSLLPRYPMAAVILVLLFGPGCASLGKVAALRSVAFSVDRVGGISLAGVDISGVSSFDQIGLLDAGRITAGVATKRLPLRMTIFVAASNPSDNPSARMARMDWSLFLNHTETVRGIVEQAIEIPTGQTVAIPVGVEVNLADFFDSGARDLVNLVLGLTGQGGTATDIRLRATPTIDTPIGPITYPRPIDIVRTRVQ